VEESHPSPYISSGFGRSPSNAEHLVSCLLASRERA
jgi:hypothetical protein